VGDPNGHGPLDTTRLFCLTESYDTFLTYVKTQVRSLPGTISTSQKSYIVPATSSDTRRSKWVEYLKGRYDKGPPHVSFIERLSKTVPTRARISHVGVRVRMDRMVFWPYIVPGQHKQRQGSILRGQYRKKDCPLGHRCRPRAVSAVKSW